MNEKTLKKIIKEETQKVMKTPIVDINIQFDFDCDKQLVSVLHKYIEFLSSELNITSKFTLVLTKNRKKHNITTLALFIIPESKLIIYVKNRNMADVLRSITHELIHKEQLDTKKFKYGDDIQDIGGGIEDEANAKAGRYIKRFGYENTEIFELNFGD